jgi:hypothetical protein
MRLPGFMVSKETGTPGTKPDASDAALTSAPVRCYAPRHLTSATPPI